MRLKTLLLKIFDIVKYLHEDVSFGTQAVNIAIESCFQNVRHLPNRNIKQCY